MAIQNSSKPALFQRFYRSVVWNKVSELRSSLSQQLLSGTGIFSLFSGSTSSGVSVNEATARTLSAVYISINVIAEEVASLKASTYIKTNDKGTQPLQGHPVSRLISKEPNRYQSSFNFWYTIIQHLKGSGNAYVKIVRDFRTRQPRELHIVHPSKVTTYFKDEVGYYYIDKEPIADTDILHFRQYTLDGFNGISPLVQNAETLGVGIKEQSFRGTSLKQRIPGYLSSDAARIEEPQVKELKANWKAQVEDSETTPLLYNGLKYNHTMLSPAEAQIIESTKATKEEIYGIFRLPPNFAQDYASNSYKGGEEQDLQFVKHTLNPILECLEQECNRKLFTESEKASETPPYINFDVNSLLRGDLKTRQSFYESAIKNGYMSPDDVREKENEPPLPDGKGKIYVMQGAMTTLENIKEGVNYTKEKETDTTIKKEETQRAKSIAQVEYKLNGHATT